MNEFVDFLRKEKIEYSICGSLIYISGVNIFIQDFDVIPENVIFSNRGSVNISNVKKISNGVKFENDDNVIIKGDDDKLEIDGDVYFYNKYPVLISKANILEGGKIFCGGCRSIYFKNTIINTEIIFYKVTNVTLPYLKFVGKEIHIRNCPNVFINEYIQDKKRLNFYQCGMIYYV